MPNWVYNTLRVKGSKKQLTDFAWAIGSPETPLDWTKLAAFADVTWDSRDERSNGELEVDDRDLVYRFNTAWNSRPQLIEDLARGYFELSFELSYLEEGPAFAGAAVFGQGKKIGESYVGDGEQWEFFEPYDDDDDSGFDGEWDYDRMVTTLLERARAGEAIDWDARRQRAEQARAAADVQRAAEAGDRLTEAVNRIQGDPALRANAKRRNAMLIPLAAATGRGLNAIPKAWWNDDLLVAFLLEQPESARLIPAPLCTEKLVDKLLAVKRGFAGLYPIGDLKVGLRNERQALAYVKQDPGALDHVPRALRSVRVCERAVRGDGTALEYVPRALRTAQLCSEAVAKNSAALAFVPNALKTADMCKAAVSHSSPNILKFVPAKYLDEALLSVAINNASFPTLELGSVNSAPLRRKYLLPIVAKNGWASVSVMSEKEHEQAWGTAEGQAVLAQLVKDDRIGLLSDVPERYHSAKILEVAGKHSPLANFEFIPDRYKTRALCVKAIEADQVGSQKLKHVPAKLRDRALCSKALDKALADFANRSRTDEFVDELSSWYRLFALEEHLEQLGDPRAQLARYFVESEFPDEVWNAELVARSKASSPYAALFLPSKFVSDQELLDLIRLQFGLYLALEESAALRLAPGAGGILRELVGEQAWERVGEWEAPASQLQVPTSDKMSTMQWHALRWIDCRLWASVLAKFPDQRNAIAKLCDGAEKYNPEMAAQTRLSEAQLHRVLLGSLKGCLFAAMNEVMRMSSAKAKPPKKAGTPISAPA